MLCLPHGMDADTLLGIKQELHTPKDELEATKEAAVGSIEPEQLRWITNNKRSRETMEASVKKEDRIHNNGPEVSSPTQIDNIPPPSNETNPATTVSSDPPQFTSFSRSPFPLVRHTEFSNELAYSSEDGWMSEGDALSLDFEATSFSDADWSTNDNNSFSDGNEVDVSFANFFTTNPPSDDDSCRTVQESDDDLEWSDAAFVEWLNISFGVSQEASMIDFCDDDNHQASVNEGLNTSNGVLLIPDGCNVIPMEAAEAYDQQQENTHATEEPLPPPQKADLEEMIPCQKIVDSDLPSNKRNKRSPSGVQAENTVTRAKGSAKRSSVGESAKSRSSDNACTSKIQQVITEDEICDNDVLFGRGGRANMHPGNVRLRALIGRTLERYKHPSSTKSAKTKIVKSIVDEIIEERGGRFLRMDAKQLCAATLSPLWVVVSRKSACYKVSQRFREDFRCTKAKKQNKHSAETTIKGRKKSSGQQGPKAIPRVLVGKSVVKKRSQNPKKPTNFHALKKSKSKSIDVKSMDAMGTHEVTMANWSKKDTDRPLDKCQDDKATCASHEPIRDKQNGAKAENILCFNEKTNSWLFKSVDNQEPANTVAP